LPFAAHSPAFIPDPPADAAADKCSECPQFVQTDNNLHPAALDARTIQGHNGELLNVVERHQHQKYCQKAAQARRGGSSNTTEPSSSNKDCRFDYPKDLCDVGHVVVKEYLAKQKEVHPELSEFIGAMDELTREIDKRVAARVAKIKTPEHVAKAFGDRAKLFRALRQRTDPLNRLHNSYFAYLLG